jgi:predicted nucleotidyltransferase component of viral defense system
MEHFGTVEPVAYSVEHEVLARVCEIPTYSLEELLGTKVRALYQRKKGRDLFDLWWANTDRELDLEGVAVHFRRYMAEEGSDVPSAAQLRANLDAKAAAGVFEEVRPLLRTDVAYDAAEALAWLEEASLPLLG